MSGRATLVMLSLLSLSVFLLGASPLAEGALDPDPVVSPPTQRRVARLPPRFFCRADSDCLNSCLYGAVNAAWHRRAGGRDRGCEDGCASHRMGAPRCVHNACVAEDRQGQRVSSCTFAEVEPELRDGHVSRDTRFSCRRDQDCTNSCSLGAINTRWYAQQRRAGRVQECRDGCAARRSGPPVCFEGACIARDHQGHRAEACVAIERDLH